MQAVLIPAHQKAVDQILDDLAEGQGDNGQVVPPEPQHRNPDDEAHDGGKEGTHHQGDDHPHQIIWDSRLQAHGGNDAGEGAHAHEAGMAQRQLSQNADGQVQGDGHAHVAADGNQHTAQRTVHQSLGLADRHHNKG